MTTTSQGALAPLFANHVRDKAEHTRVLAGRVDEATAEALLTKDLALHAAITYYAAVTQNGSSHPPKAETITRAASAFEDYYMTVWEAPAKERKEQNKIDTTESR